MRLVADPVATGGAASLAERFETAVGAGAVGASGRSRAGSGSLYGSAVKSKALSVLEKAHMDCFFEKK